MAKICAEERQWQLWPLSFSLSLCSLYTLSLSLPLFMVACWHIGWPHDTVHWYCCLMTVLTVVTDDNCCVGVCCDDDGVDCWLFDLLTCCGIVVIAAIVDTFDVVLFVAVTLMTYQAWCVAVFGSLYCVLLLLSNYWLQLCWLFSDDTEVIWYWLLVLLVIFSLSLSHLSLSHGLVVSWPVMAQLCGEICGSCGINIESWKYEKYRKYRKAKWPVISRKQYRQMAWKPSASACKWKLAKISVNNVANEIISKEMKESYQPGSINIMWRISAKAGVA